MKVIKKILVAILAIATIGYLLGSFANASFNLSYWDETSRNITATIMALFMFVCLIVILNIDAA